MKLRGRKLKQAWKNLREMRHLLIGIQEAATSSGLSDFDGAKAATELGLDLSMALLKLEIALGEAGAVTFEVKK